MKRFYILFSVLLISGGLYAQMGPSWWQMLPADWQTNPFPRDTVSILKVVDGAIDEYASLADLWTGISAEEIPVDNTTNGACSLLDANDYSGIVKMFFDNTAYYVLFNVNDEDIQIGAGLDCIEMHLAPYVDSINPGRTIIPAGYEPAGATDTVGDYNFWGRWISGAEWVRMSYRGSWSEVGAYKTEWLLASSEEAYPAAPIYVVAEGPEGDTIKDVQMGSPTVAFSSIYTPKTGGYYFLAIMPLELFPEVPDAETFPAMSVAFKVNDKDADDQDCTTDDEETAVDRHEAWGATTSNESYWAIAFYGGVGEFDFISQSVPSLKTTVSSVYYHAGDLVIERHETVRDLAVYNITGALVRNIQRPGERVSVSDLQNGVYLVRLTEYTGSSAVIKIVK